MILSNQRIIDTYIQQESASNDCQEKGAKRWRLCGGPLICYLCLIIGILLLICFIIVLPVVVVNFQTCTTMESRGDPSKQCPDIPRNVLDNSKLITGKLRGNSYNDSVWIRCNQGYTFDAANPLENGRGAVCQEDGQWDQVLVGCQDFDECESKPCANGGACTQGEPGDYSCTCAEGYSGDKCDAEIDECASNPCLNGANCEDSKNGYVCNCTKGYIDANCQTDFDECESKPCANGGICIQEDPGEFNCTCPEGYIGERCETEIDECASNPCQNGGTCVDSKNSYVCECIAGYTDKHCETDINECEVEPCYNGGTCIDLMNDYNCSCVNGSGGRNCQEDTLDDCEGNPCGACYTCIDRLFDVYCDYKYSPLPLNCMDIKQKNSTAISGRYHVDLTMDPNNPRSVEVYCDMDTDEGGWLVFQRRTDGSENFNRNWDEYKDGFGDLDNEFWLGNENLHQILNSCGREYEFRADITDLSDNEYYAKYSIFNIADSADKYRLHLPQTVDGTAGGEKTHSGTADDTFIFSKGCQFSASDQINSMNRHCKDHEGGWWYNAGMGMKDYPCASVYLNGIYSTQSGVGMNKIFWTTNADTLKFTEMKIRPKP